MKILCVIQCSHLGGMEKVTLDSLSLLQDAGHEVRLFSLHPIGDLKALAEVKGVPLFGTDRYRLRGIGNVDDILDAIRQFAPERLWLVGHNYGSLLAARRSGLPTFQSIHYHHSESSRLHWRCFYGVARRFCKSIHFVSRYIFDEVADLFRESDHVVCFPNMLSEPDSQLSRDEARTRLGLPSAAFVVGNAGWLIPRKAFDVFLRTAAEIHARIPDAIFLVAGDGPERERLEQLAANLGIAGAVRFLGWQRDLAAVYGAMDVLLFNSHFDCLPTTPLEAMVSNIPVVCSLTHGGLKEVLRHGQDGYLIDVHDTSALADEVVRLYGNHTAAAELARRGRMRVLDVCSRDKHLEYLNDFLEIQ